jgi:hypothetical protein
VKAFATNQRLDNEAPGEIVFLGNRIAERVSEAIVVVDKLSHSTLGNSRQLSQARNAALEDFGRFIAPHRAGTADRLSEVAALELERDLGETVSALHASSAILCISPIAIEIRAKVRYRSVAMSLLLAEDSDIRWPTSFDSSSPRSSIPERRRTLRAPAAANPPAD